MIACPKCKGYMFTRKRNGVEIDLCSQCSGIWLDEGELATLAETKRDVPQEGQKKTPTRFKCPRCGQVLDEMLYTQGQDLLVDVCSSCSGVYLDQGELEQVRGLSGHVDAAFPQTTRSRMQKTAQRRENLSALYKAENPVAKQSIADRGAFVRKVYSLLCVTLIITTIGTFAGLASPPEMFFPAIIVELILFFSCLSMRKVAPANTFLLLAYTFASGFTLASVIRVKLATGDAWAVGAALVITTVIFLALTAYVHITRVDLDWMGGFLFIGLLGIVIGFVALLVTRQPVPAALSAFSAIIFSGYILYDTSRILLKFQEDEVVSAVLELYLDIINLFLDILRLMSKK
jgi:FtsH-binding integral membrane protein